MKRALLAEDGFSGYEECPIRAVRLGRIGQFDYPGKTCGGPATFDDGNTRMTAPGWHEIHKSFDWFALCRQGKGKTVELITAGDRCIGADRI
jgi:hypothetical protein